MSHTLCYYKVQVEFNLQVHTEYNNLRPQAPILFLYGGVGTPTESSLDVLLEWCSSNWQRVYIFAGDLEILLPLYFKGVCRKHANVCVVDHSTVDTFFEGLCVVGSDECRAALSPTHLTTVTLSTNHLTVHWPSSSTPLPIHQPGVYQVTVTPPDCAHTIERGWAKVAPRPLYHKVGYGNSCRTCGYHNHKPWECPVSTKQEYKFVG